VKRRIAQALFRVGAVFPAQALAAIVPQSRVVVLNLHRVNPYRDMFAEAMHPNVFDALVGLLTARFEITTFRALSAEAAAPRRARVVLSFDDGYHDFVEYVLPILERHGVRCNLNLIAGSIATGQPPFVGRLSAVLRDLSCQQLAEIRVPGFGRNFAPGDDKTIFRNRLSNYLKSRSVESRRDILADSSRWFASAIDTIDVHPQDRMMTAAEVQACARHELGNHSYSHESMAFQSEDFFLADLERAEDLFAKSRVSPTAYAFPNGSYTNRQISVLARRGVHDVLLVRQGHEPVDCPAGTTVWTRYGFQAASVEEAKLKVMAAAFQTGKAI
jgi:peptidoglycan/xylan/chitin deacetylase (PgdA/CDA1 family)